MEAEDFYRRAQQGTAQRALGMGTASGRFALYAPAPHVESLIRNLPVYTRTQTPLQNPATGALYFIMGLSGIGVDQLG